MGFLPFFFRPTINSLRLDKEAERRQENIMGLLVLIILILLLVGACPRGRTGANGVWPERPGQSIDRHLLILLLFERAPFGWY